ncbi:MAG: carboxypeptidase-like regulatory domain-containing protein [Planctomycetaceae bacterium]
MKLQNNQVKLTAPAGATLRYEPESLVGYFLNARGETATVVAGVGPQEIEVAVIPARAVHGTLVDAQGKAISGFIDVVPADAGWLDRFGQKAPDLNSAANTADVSFFRTLPSGSRYVVTARGSGRDQQLFGVSEPFLIDGEHPVHELKVTLKPGRTVKVRLLNSDNGTPIPDVTVTLELSRAATMLNKSTGFHVPGKSDHDGVVVWEDVLPDVVSEAIAYSGTLRLENIPGYRGQFVKLEELKLVNGVYDVTLRHGLSASGFVIDADTGRPVPNASVRLHPTDFSRADFPGGIEAKTDSTGRFEFTSLEPIEYTGNVRSTTMKGAIVEVRPGGSYRITRFPDPQPTLRLTGGSKDVVHWEVQLLPGQGLAPLPE